MRQRPTIGGRKDEMQFRLNLHSRRAHRLFVEGGGEGLGRVHRGYMEIYCDDLVVSLDRVMACKRRVIETEYVREHPESVSEF